MLEDQKIAPNLRVIRILEILASHNEPLSPTELNAVLKMPKQSIHRLCTMLIDEGYLQKIGRKLAPSTRLLTMATGLEKLGIANTACHQILRKIAHQFGETVNLVRPEKTGMNYVDRVETNWPFRILLPIGTHVPFHCTASGKTYLASLPKYKRQQLTRTMELNKQTAYTIDNAEQLEAELATVRAQRYATDKEEFYTGMVAIAVPITDLNGDYFGALAVHGPSSRFSLDEAIEKRDSMQNAAKEIQLMLFS